ncbi:MAG TPA: roadblock/LC7 domain-containing protein [Chloroflexia bacterium]|nr:roadblock/LC7 domain-containing protein [Chloroflexia bacterium]
MAAIKDVLNKFRAVNSVDIAVIVNSDGMQIESFSRGNLDVDEVCAVASTGLQLSDALGGATARGETRQAVMEYAGGAIVLEPLTEDAMMVVVSTDPNSIGKIRYLSKRYRQEILSALNGA